MQPSISQAAAVAIEAHGEQKYGTRPYVSHLVMVVENLHRFGVATPELEAAAWLHDTVEDTELGLDRVQAEFGERVAALVHAVTSEDGPNRKERNGKTYPKIASTPGAVRLKLADRIANVESCWIARSPKLFMYHREYTGFRDALRQDGDQVTLLMWNHLDQLLGR